MRECPDCDYVDCTLPVGGAKYVCPKCGGKMNANFDEEGDHDDRYEREADLETVGEEDAEYFEQAGIRGFGDE